MKSISSQTQVATQCKYLNKAVKEQKEDEGGMVYKQHRFCFFLLFIISLKFLRKDVP